MITEPYLSRPVPARAMAMGSVLAPPRPAAPVAGRSWTASPRVATRRTTFELPRRQRVLRTVAGCTAAGAIVLQALALATLL